MARILISGASVGGPAAAVALSRAGHAVVVVEVAEKPRVGGYAVDFRGRVHLGVLKRLGVLDDLRAVATTGSATRFLLGDRTRLALPEEFTGGDLDVLRRDLTRVLVEHSDRADYRYGSSIVELQDRGQSVEATFADGGRESFDIVIGADGIHSRTRALMLGAESAFVTHQGYCVAGWDLPNTVGATRDLTIWNAPGRAMGVSTDPRDPSRANVFAIFESAPLPREVRHDRHAQEDVLRRALAGVGPHADAMLRELSNATDLYLDAIARADVPHWSRGRTVLIGDAAHGATLGGMGTGSAVVGALVLAHRLGDGADHARAFADYESVMRPYATACQQGGDTAGRFFAPRTRLGIATRNWFFRTAAGRRTLLDTGRDRSEALPESAIPA